MAVGITFGVLDNRQLVRDTDDIAELGNSPPGTAKIPELVLTIQRNCAPVDVSVDVFFVRMGANDKSVFAFQKAGSKFIPHLLCFLWGNLSRLKGLPYLIGNHIAFLLPACELHILPLGKEELCIRCMRVTGIPSYPKAGTGVGISAGRPSVLDGSGFDGSVLTESVFLFSGIGLSVFNCEVFIGYGSAVSGSSISGFSVSGWLVSGEVVSGDGVCGYS